MIPIRTSISPRRTPYANYALIMVNVLCFVLTSRFVTDPRSGERFLTLWPWAEQFMITPVRPYIWQFVTYAFLHGSVMHILGNMYFLYMFGNNVNDKLGNIGYVCFYLAGAVFSGLGHTILHVNPVLGASGAVAAVTGAYLVLFPKTVITVLYWFILIGTVDISALYFIVFKMIFWDNIIESQFSEAAVAYDAHISGYLFGVASIMTLLSLKLIDSNFSDLWSIIKQWNRRRKFRDTVSQGYNPFVGRVSRKVVNSSEVETKQSPKQRQTSELRSQILSLINQKNLAHAAQVYEQLNDLDPQQVLPRQHQLDIANQLMSMGKWAISSQAYEKFLKYYSSYEYAEQVHLMLGILYSRYLKNRDLAVKHLKIAEDRLSDAGQIKMCKEELETLDNGPSLPT